jgi:ABC-type sugar transport system substrate-binding protein
MKKLALLLVVLFVLAPVSTLAEGPINVAVIIKATTSDFWQYVLIGANNYAVEYPERVKVTTYGPPS